MGKKIPREALRETAVLYLGGLSLSETGERLGISGAAVSRQLEKLGIQRRRAGGTRCPLTVVFANLRAYGVSVEQIARTYNIGRSTVYERLERRAFNRKAWARLLPFTDHEMVMVYASYVESALSFPDIIDVVRDHRALVKDQRHHEKEAPQREKACHLIDHRPNP